MTVVLKTIDEVRQFRQSQQNKKVGFVPTMGNLHAGHLSLMKMAKANSDVVIASIYVNPTQFAPSEDLDSYPRTFDEDLEKLTALGVDAVFYPDEKVIYPYGKDNTLSIELPKQLTQILCGLGRPSHFQGVATVVAKLFQIVQPHVAVFGKKDFQQLTVIRRLVTELFMDIEIIGGEIIRETSGLAMSSRNQYLTDNEQKQAENLHKVLKWAREQLLAGQSETMILEKAKQHLLDLGVDVEYLDLRDKETLQESPELSNAILLVAARVGKTRLIDNVLVG